MSGRPLEPDPVDTGVGISGLTLQASLSQSVQAPGFRLEGSGFAYGRHAVLAPYMLDLAPGETVAILGPSGCGKSTLLRLLAGLLPGGPAKAPAAAWMAQQDLLLPWATILDNVLLGARLRGEAPDAARARDLLTRLGLADWAAAYPAALSGGMRQRAALARTLMEDRPLVLMDEPFSALDAITREVMQNLAAELLANRAVLLVTHDPAEACRLADRVFVMVGQPATLRLVAKLTGDTPRDALAPDIVYMQRTIHAALKVPA